MMVANAFDMWQKDAFFPAAEEVQESADLMESTYREWDRVRKDVVPVHDLNYLSRDLQTTLGTAKWQLEEFEKAVRVSYGHHHGDKNTTSLHGQFIDAIKSQISRVEAELQEYLCEGGKQPIRWVNLDEEERDDLALFLAGNGMNSQVLHTFNNEFVERVMPKQRSGNSGSDDYHKKEDAESSGYSACSRGLLDDYKGFKDIKANDGNNNSYVMEIEATEIHGKVEDMNYTSKKRPRGSANVGDWRIVIPAEDTERTTLLSNCELTPKEKGVKGLFSKQRIGEQLQIKLPTACFNQIFGRVNLYQRQPQCPRNLQLRCSVQVMLALMLTIFLIVPFLFYST